MMQYSGATGPNAVAGSRATSMAHSTAIVGSPVQGGRGRSRGLPGPAAGMRTFFSMQQQRARAAPNIGSAYRGTEMSTLDDSNKPTVTTLFSKIWPTPLMPYHTQQDTHDVLFKVNGVDDIPDQRWRRWMNQGTVLNLQQLNHELLLGMPRATSSALDAMRLGKHHLVVNAPEYPDIDMEWLLRCANQNEQATEFDTPRKVTRDIAEKIMREDVEAWEAQVKDLVANVEGAENAENPALVVGREVVQAVWDNYDAHKMTENMELAARYHDLMNKQMYFLFPQLIHRKYSFFGTVEDALQPSQFHRQTYNTQGGMTVAVRGPARCKNIFGQPAMKKLRRGPQVHFPKTTLKLLSQLHVVLTTPRDMMGVYRSPDGMRTFNMSPIVAVPACVTSKAELFARMEVDNLFGGPLACMTQSGVYTKTVPRAAEKDGYEFRMVGGEEGHSWYLGRILEIEPFKPMPDHFFRTAIGAVDYTNSAGRDMSPTFEDVLEKRKAVRTIKLNVRTK